MRLQHLVLIVVLALAGCTTPYSSVDDRLYFGRSIPGGGEVSDAQWDAFVSEVVIPRFPYGFSIWRGRGHWRGDDGLGTSEESIVLEIVHERDPAIDAKLDEIARIYRERFNQDAVMQVRLPAAQKFSRRLHSPSTNP